MQINLGIFQQKKNNNKGNQMINGNEKYSIKVTDEYVLIHGYLSIDEAFKFMNYYRDLGFTCLTPGDENSCMMMFKKDFTKKQEREEKEKVYDQNDFISREEAIEMNTQLEKYKAKILELESLIKELFKKNDLGTQLCHIDELTRKIKSYEFFIQTMIEDIDRSFLSVMECDKDARLDKIIDHYKKLFIYSKDNS